LGPLSGRLKIHTNNEVQPVLEIPVSLDVVGEIAVEPSRLFFGLIKQGGEAKKTIRLSSSNRSFKILRVFGDLEFVRISQTSEAAGSNHTLTATIEGDAPPGRFKGTITILTDNKYQPEIKVSVIGTVSSSK